MVGVRSAASSNSPARTSRHCPTATPLLEALQVVYQAGSSAYFRALDRALQVCADGGEPIPHTDLRRCLRQAVAAAGEHPSLDDALAAYAEKVLVAAHRAPPHGSGLYVMTVHQAKGKEFDAVVIGDGFRRFYGDDEESRNLFYVALTRATKRWTVIAPDDDAQATPLLPPSAMTSIRQQGHLIRRCSSLLCGSSIGSDTGRRSR